MKPKRKHQLDLSLLSLAFGGAIAFWVIPQANQQQLSLPALASAAQSQHYEVVEGSIYDGDTLRVTDGTQEIKVRLCGIDAPEKDQALGTASRDHLRNLVAQGRGRITLVETDVDRYNRTVAEAFVSTGSGEEEIYLNAQMVADGMAYTYPQYVGSCPNGSVIEAAEAEARRTAAGVWSSPSSQKPWEYRRRS